MQLQPWRRSVDVQTIAPSCCLDGKPFLVFATRAIWVHTVLQWFPIPVLTWFPQHTSLLMMSCSYVSSLILLMYSSPFPLHTCHLSTTSMHISSCYFQQVVKQSIGEIKTVEWHWSKPSRRQPYRHLYTRALVKDPFELQLPLHSWVCWI